MIHAIIICMYNYISIYTYSINITGIDIYVCIYIYIYTYVDRWYILIYIYIYIYTFCKSNLSEIFPRTVWNNLHITKITIKSSFSSILRVLRFCYLLVWILLKVIKNKQKQNTNFVNLWQKGALEVIKKQKSLSCFEDILFNL